MARSLTESEYIYFSLGQLNFAPPITAAALVKLHNVTLGDEYILRVLKTDFTGGWELLRQSDSDIGMRIYKVGSSTGLESSTLGFDVADDWCVIGFNKASGTTAARFFKVPLSTGIAVFENSAATAAAYDLGIQEASFAFGDFDVACAGVWNTVLSDSEIDSLDGDFINWTQAKPGNIRAMWRLNQASIAEPVPDYTGGGANQQSISGTSIVADPLGFDLEFDYAVRPMVVV